MCVAVYKPIGANLPTERELEAMYAKNPDGAGFAYTNKKSGVVTWSKGYFDVFDWMTEAFMAESADRAMFLHCRWATHGEINAANCHPFPITGCFDKMGKSSGSSRVGCIMHNGVLCNDITRDDISDTMQAVGDIARCGLHKSVDRNPAAVRLIEMVFSGSRGAIMLPGARVVLTGEWLFDANSGCYISNNKWKSALRPQPRKGVWE